MSRNPASRWRGLLLGFSLGAFALLIIVPAAHAAGRIYWSNYDTNTIAWANLDGSGNGGTVNTAGATVRGPMGMTVDPARGLIYWANWRGDTGTTISYAHLDGSGGGNLNITGLLTDLGQLIGMRLRGHPVESWKISTPLLLSLSFASGAAVGAILKLKTGVPVPLACGSIYVVGGLVWSVLKRKPWAHAAGNRRRHGAD